VELAGPIWRSVDVYVVPGGPDHTYVVNRPEDRPAGKETVGRRRSALARRSLGTDRRRPMRAAGSVTSRAATVTYRSLRRQSVHRSAGPLGGVLCSVATNLRPLGESCPPVDVVGVGLDAYTSPKIGLLLSWSD